MVSIKKQVNWQTRHTHTGDRGGKNIVKNGKTVCGTHVNRLSLAVIVCRLACAHRALLHCRIVIVVVVNAVCYGQSLL